MLPAPTQKKAKPPIPTKLSIYNEFCVWYAMPHAEQIRLGITSQLDFAAKYAIDKTTPTRWKARPDFKPTVDALRKQWGYEKTPNVLQAMYRSALKGNPLSQKLWLEYFEGFSEKHDVSVTNKVEVGINDIRFIIEQLPEPLKSKHYANLRELLDDADAFRNAREAEDGSGADGTASALPGETDNPAPDVPDGEADAVAEGNPGSVRQDMVGQI